MLIQEAAVRVEEGPAQPGQETFLEWLVRRAGEVAPAEVKEGLRVVMGLGHGSLVGRTALCFYFFL